MAGALVSCERLQVCGGARVCELHAELVPLTADEVVSCAATPPLQPTRLVRQAMARERTDPEHDRVLDLEIDSWWRQARARACHRLPRA